MSRRKRSDAPRQGRLFILGGGEDREDDKLVLSRFVELAGGEDARIVVLTAASRMHDEMWSIYDQAFGALGVKQRSALVIDSRGDANGEDCAAQVFDADAVFMTGGDQKRLLQLVGGTRVDHAMHRAFRERGICVAGTSAGASAMSEHMLWEGGNREQQPQKNAVSLGAGLGFLRRVVVDQHFSERHRLGRLLSVVAQNPYLLGCGIDEDTALLVEPGAGLEVVGAGSVTVLDGRDMLSNYLDLDTNERLELSNVKLHLLPAGARYSFRLDGDGDAPRSMPAGLRDVVAAVSGVPAQAQADALKQADAQDAAADKAHDKSGGKA